MVSNSATWSPNPETQLSRNPHQVPEQLPDGSRITERMVRYVFGKIEILGLQAYSPQYLIWKMNYFRGTVNSNTVSGYSKLDGSHSSACFLQPENSRQQAAQSSFRRQTPAGCFSATRYRKLTAIGSVLARNRMRSAFFQKAERPIHFVRFCPI